MERSLFGFIIRYSKRDQLRIVPFVLMTMVVYYASLDLPKTIINEAIQGGSFPEGAQTTKFLWFELGRIEYLFALPGLGSKLAYGNGVLVCSDATYTGYSTDLALTWTASTLDDPDIGARYPNNIDYIGGKFWIPAGW